MTWLLDLDGVVWLSGRGIPGSGKAVERLRANGEKVAFFTNNSAPTLAEQVAALGGAGVAADPEEVLTSSQAAASMLVPGSRAAVVGGPGVAEALAEAGVDVVPADARPDAVVVGRTTDISYSQMAAAARAIRDGARFVATNMDATMPTPGGPEPGAGALVAFLEVSSGVAPLVAGKPSQPAADLVASRVGPVSLMVGDRADTDGLFARAIRARFALVLTGVTRRRDLPVEPEPDLVAANLAAVVEQVLGGD